MLLKQAYNEYIKLEINFFNLSKIYIEIPEMIFTIKNQIPLLCFEYKLNGKNNKISKSSKAVILSLRDWFIKLNDIINTFIKQINFFKKLFRILINKIKITYLNIDVTFGSENAALTGFLAGQIWSLIYQGLSLFSLYFSFENAKIKTNVRPDFLKNKHIQININCIFQLRVGHIIIASFIVTWYWLLFNIRLKMSR